MSPDVEGLIGHLEKAEDAGSGGTLRVPVAKEDALLMEHLGHLVYAEQPGQLQAQHREAAGQGRGWPGLAHSPSMAWGARLLPHSPSWKVSELGHWFMHCVYYDPLGS